MSKTTFKSDIKRTLTVFAILPLIVLSILLITKIYFTFEEIDKINHEKILKAIDYKLNEFFDNVIYKANFIKKYKTHNRVKLNNFINLNKELDSVIVLNKNGIVQNIVSRYDIKIFTGFDYSNRPLYKKFIKTQKPFFSTAHLSAVTSKATVSYIFSNKDKIFIFNINLNSLESYIGYLKSNTDLMIIISDKHGQYIVNKSLMHNEKTSFFLTDIYKKGIKNIEPSNHFEIYDECLKSKIFIMYVKNKRSNWFVVTIDKDKIDNTIMYIILWTILFISIILSFMFINATKFTNHVIDPLEKLIEKMEQFTSTNDIKKLTIDTNYPMFKTIANSFNKMQETIIQKQKRIKEEVEANKQKEEILFEQSKMAAMGEMIGNIAHQWRQPLSTISTAASGTLLEKEYDILTDEKLQKHMNTIIDSTEFLSSTIDDFRNFFKKDKEKKLFNIKNVINKNLVLLDGALKNGNIKVVANLEDIQFLGYENEMIQALLNILNNAKDILKDKNDHNKIIRIDAKKYMDKIIISIHDSGGGVPQAIIHRVFEPYFTTKHKSQGTGIGLYMTREIIMKHMNGNINISNEAFEYDGNKYFGANFVIELSEKVD